MSLFRLKNAWTTQCSTHGHETLGVAALAVGNLANINKSTEQIVVGSEQGIIRVFDPLVNEEDGEWGCRPFSSNHVLIEMDLQEPILQVEIGCFASTADNKQLAILHPRMLTVYALKVSEASAVAHGSQFDLVMLYQHKLHRQAYNMVFGPFGGSEPRDFICVQSLDGCLAVFEQETQAFSRFLPQTLLAGPLVYVPMTDSFVTVSSSLSLCSYKYHVLAVAVEVSTREEANTRTSGKRVSPDWSQQLGEAALDINVLEMSPAQPSLLVLGERSVFCFTEGGNIRYCNKFDYGAISMLTYSSTSEGFAQYLVGTETKTLLVYSDTSLKWAAQLEFVPVQVRRSQHGMLITIGERGEVTCGYLGTDPALYGLATTASAHIDTHSKQLEYKTLQAKLKNRSAKDIELSNVSSKIEELTVTCTVPSKLDDISLVYDSNLTDENLPSITIRLTLSARVPLENVQVFVRASAPLCPHQNSFSCSVLSASIDIPVTFFVRSSEIPSNLTAKVMCTYLNTAGSNKLISSEVDIPVSLVAFVDKPVKQTAFKITIESNKPTVNLNKLFPEFVTSESPPDMQEMGLKLFGSRAIVTILVSQNTRKYRIQADVFEAMWVFLFELWQRLGRHFMGTTDLSVFFSGNLPLTEYFVLVDQHFDLQIRKRKLAEVLSQRCTQLRAIQRQVLVKLKDTTPSPLSHLDGLLELTHQQVISLATGIQDLQTKLGTLHNAISASTRQTLFLLRLQNNIAEPEFIQVQAALCPAVDEFPEQTWEERTDAAVSHVLHMLSKGHSASSPASQQLPKMSDPSRLKKHITLLCEKLNKGSHVPATRAMSASVKSQRKLPQRSIGAKLETIVEDTNLVDINENELGEGDAPAGAEFIDMKSGALGNSKSVDENLNDEDEEEDYAPFLVGNGKVNVVAVNNEEAVVIENNVSESEVSKGDEQSSTGVVVQEDQDMSFYSGF